MPKTMKKNLADKLFEEYIENNREKFKSMTKDEIAEEFGVSCYSASKIINEMKIEYSHSRILRHYDDEFLRNHTIQESCRFYGANYATVKHYMYTKGITPIKAPVYKREIKTLKQTLYESRAIEMAQLYNSGKTYKEIGEIYGVSREMVRQTFVQHHFKIVSYVFRDCDSPIIDPLTGKIKGGSYEQHQTM